jgi:hypothetical protein
VQEGYQGAEIENWPENMGKEGRDAKGEAAFDEEKAVDMDLVRERTRGSAIPLPWP